jgi:ATP-dependent RNA helicase DDX3X
MRKLARKYLSIDHIRIRIGRAGSAHGNIKQQVRTYSFSSWRQIHWQIGFLVRPEQQEAGHLRPSSFYATITDDDFL